MSDKVTVALPKLFTGPVFYNGSLGFHNAEFIFTFFHEDDNQYATCGHIVICRYTNQVICLEFKKANPEINMRDHKSFLMYRRSHGILSTTAQQVMPQNALEYAIDLQKQKAEERVCIFPIFLRDISS